MQTRHSRQEKKTPKRVNEKTSPSSACVRFSRDSATNKTTERENGERRERDERETKERENGDNWNAWGGIREKAVDNDQDRS